MPLSERDLLILRQVALKAAVESTKGKVIVDYKVDVQEVAESYYSWLQEPFKPKNLLKNILGKEK